MRSLSSVRLLAALLALPLLAGCFSASPETEGAAGDSADGARLRVALAFPPAENLSPYGADATILSRLGVTEGLTALDANGAAGPALAASWQREDDRSWLFTLREATFQDGTDVTASAVAASLTHATQARPEPAALTGVTLTAKPEGSRQVRITTEEPDPVLPFRLASPSLAILSGKAYEEEGRVDPVGTATGPFALTEVGGTSSATLTRYDDYWGGLAQASGIDVKFIADGTARSAALRTGQVDIAEAIPVAQAASLEQNTLRETATTRTTGLLLNSKSGAFKDAGLRAAARAAVDTSALADGVYEGHADAGVGIYGPAVTWAEGKRQQPVGRAKAGSPTVRPSPSPPTTTGPSCPRSPRYSSSSWRRPGSRSGSTSASTRGSRATRWPGSSTPSCSPATAWSTPATRSPSSPATTPATAATTSRCCATRTSTGPSPRPRARRTPASGRTPP